MDVTFLIEQLAADGPLLVEAASGADWDAPVPGTEWNLRDLITHLGGVHRWAADIVETASDTADTAAGAIVGIGPPDDELLEWFREGHAALVETLSAAPEDLECFTFLPADSPLHFWARRQAHETAIHRADAEAAAGREVTVFDDDFAQDGIAEVLLGFARRRASAIPVPGAIGLDAVDGPSWLITLGLERTEATPSEDLVATDVAVRGLSSDLYLWVWNRPADVVIDGDEEVAARWAESVRVRWT